MELSEETRNALAKYQKAHGIDNREEAIQRLLPNWAFNEFVPPKFGRLKDTVEQTNHYHLELSHINSIEDLELYLNEAKENGDEELINEIETIMEDVSRE